MLSFNNELPHYKCSRLLLSSSWQTTYCQRTDEPSTRKTLLNHLLSWAYGIYFAIPRLQTHPLVCIRSSHPHSQPASNPESNWANINPESFPLGWPNIDEVRNKWWWNGRIARTLHKQLYYTKAHMTDWSVTRTGGGFPLVFLLDGHLIAWRKFSSRQRWSGNRILGITLQLFRVGL